MFWGEPSSSHSQTETEVLSDVDLKHLSQPFHVSPENLSFSGILMVPQMFTFHLYGTVEHTGVVGSTQGRGGRMPGWCCDASPAHRHQESGAHTFPGA